MSSEAKLSYTTKVKGTDLLTARGDTEAEFNQSYEAMLRIKARIEGSPVEQPTVQQAVQTVTQAMPGSQVVEASTNYEERTDQFGNTFTNQVNGTGTCAHGPRILAKRTNKEGAGYERYECVNNTPFRVGKYDSNAVCKHAYPDKKAA